MDIGVDEIRRWHTDPPPKGNGWRDIGYHYVIRRNGTLERGRDELVAGAHVANHNADSIGICLVGGREGPDYTQEQWACLASLVRDLAGRYAGAEVKGHADFDGRKQCPQFDVKDWWSRQ